MNHVYNTLKSSPITSFLQFCDHEGHHSFTLLNSYLNMNQWRFQCILVYTCKQSARGGYNTRHYLHREQPVLVLRIHWCLWGERKEKERREEKVMKCKIPGDGHLFNSNIHKNHRLPEIYMTTGNIKNMQLRWWRHWEWKRITIKEGMGRQGNHWWGGRKWMNLLLFFVWVEEEDKLEECISLSLTQDKWLWETGCADVSPAHLPFVILSSCFPSSLSSLHRSLFQWIPFIYPG